MAKVTTKTPKGKDNLLNMPTVSDPSAEPPTQEPPPATTEPPATTTKVEEVESNKQGRPSKDGLNFFQRLGHYPREDWEGDRLIIYAYRLQPFTDRLAGGEKHVFLTKYSGVIDEMTILTDHGSGRYHFKLNRAIEGQSKTKPVDLCNVDILNPAFPPKIPIGEWVDDPRNHKWAWAAPKGSKIHAEHQPAAPPSPAVAAADLMQTVFDVAERINERNQPTAAPAPPPPPDPLKQMEGMAKIIRDITPAPTAEKKPEENAVLTLVMRQLDTMDRRLAEETRRNHELEKEMRSAAAAPPPKNELMEQLQAKFFTKMLEDKPINAEVVDGSGRRTNWLDVAKEVGVAFFESPVAANLSQALMYAAMRPAPAPQAAPIPAYTPPPPQPAGLPGPGVPPPPPPQPQPVQQQPPAPQPGPVAVPPPPPPINPGAPMKLSPQMLAPFVKEIIGPLMAHIEQEKDGYDLADWVISGKGKQAYLFIRNQGSDTLMQAFRLSEFWQATATHPGLVAFEPQLKEFVTQFCAWPPPEEDDEEEDEEEEGDDEPEDLTEDK